MPVLYLLLLTNAVSIGYTHYGIAPDYLTLYVPSVLSIVCLLRALKWLSFRHITFTLEEAEHQINMTILFAIVLGIGFIIWGFSLYAYGDLLHKSHVAYFLSITVVGIIVCLIHLPAAALSLTAVTVVSFVIFFVSSGNPVFIAIAVNFLLVSIVLVWVVISYYRAFSGIIYSRIALEKEHHATELLNNKNERLANEDGLTKLANRRSFFSHLAKLIDDDNSLQDEGREQFVVGLIDLDGFKPVNDIYGHAAGDRVLVDVGKRLTKVLNGTGVLARLGGDEFGIIIDKPLTKLEIKNLSTRFSTAIQEPFQMRSGTAQVSGSCGFAIYPDAGTTPEQLMDRADFALYHAKENNRGSSVIFSSVHEQFIKKEAQIEQALKLAVEQDELQLYYQPIIDGWEENIVGYEALARWDHEVLGSIEPDKFIPMAEKMGIISDISTALFEKAVADVLGWPENIYLSFNLSALDVTRTGVVERFYNIAKKHMVNANRIQFEITETAVVQDLGVCQKTLEDFRGLGFKITIDDFGSGYSSLGHIHKLSFDKLKIDPSFIHDIAVSERGLSMIKTILEMCKNLEIECAAEGIETLDQKSQLLSLGCTEMQGFYFSKPKPMSDIHFS